MAAALDVYATVAAMQAVTPATDGTLAVVSSATAGKSVLYVYRTVAAVGAANAGWYKTVSY
jgi:hypothetical protein